MGENFKRFKSKAFVIRLVKSILVALASGLLISGVLMLLWKLQIIDFWQWLSVIIGAASAPVIWFIAFLLIRRSDASLARTLDTEFGLDERVQTMVQYSTEEGEIFSLQREDAERALGQIPTKRFKARFVWIYALVLLLAASVFTVSLLVPDSRSYEPPDVVIPFELSAMQAAALEKLIADVDSSSMEEPYKSVISGELTELLSNLREADTETEMRAALASSLTVITEATYNSSSMTEILNALWQTGNAQLRLLAKALDTSTLPEASWGDYAERYNELIKSFDLMAAHSAENPDTPPDEAELLVRLKWMVEDISIKAPDALESSGIAKEDILYAAIHKMLNADGSEYDFVGFVKLVATFDTVSYGKLYGEADGTFRGMTDEFFDVITVQKNNTNVGEGVLKKLASLFMVAIPQFERPNLKEGSSDDGSGNEGEGSGGGVGEGVEFGSDDLVLDPLTGKYVTYGTLYAKYNTLMIEKLEDGKYNYTEEQRRAIEKYFALLYSGLKDED